MMARGTPPRLLSFSISFVKLGGRDLTAPTPFNRFPAAERSVRALRGLKSGSAYARIFFGNKTTRKTHMYGK